LIDNLYKSILLFFSIVMAGGQIGINVGALLAGFGVAGIAIGFAAQDSLANTIAGFLIFWGKPFELGDWITVAEQYGQVTHITLRSTRIRIPLSASAVWRACVWHLRLRTCLPLRPSTGRGNFGNCLWPAVPIPSAH
jgi:MscS family membrane protein